MSKGGPTVVGGRRPMSERSEGRVNAGEPTRFQGKWCQPFLYDSPGTVEPWNHHFSEGHFTVKVHWRQPLYAPLLATRNHLIKVVP